YVEPGKEDRCDWAMESLKKSFAWDEEHFGLEYDLDIFMIVAVSDFNMGAMENKGLNIFNDKYILATPQSATDADYTNIEAIIAHEYFHNWTGNRITCRDWFQLCLKEGLTVFRDQEFSSDLRSRPVKRIADVVRLRHDQFPEDAGPLAHPVRPASYIEINNFYTATVYEKGAELCRMLHTLLGEVNFRKAMDLYFERHDGEAATVEDFISCMADASGCDLNQFFKWYEQAGTPEITARGTYDAQNEIYTLSLSQEIAPTPGQEEKRPQHIPLRAGLVGPDGIDLVQEKILELTEKVQTFTFKGVKASPVLSLNRGFSAPVTLNSDLSDGDELFLFAHDSDAFNRWEMGRSYARKVLARMAREIRDGGKPSLDEQLVVAFKKIIDEVELEDTFRALLLSLPSESEVANYIGEDIDPGAIHEAVEALEQHVGSGLLDPFKDIYAQCASNEAYMPSPEQIGQRSLKALALRYILAGAPQEGLKLAAEQAAAATNMSEEMSALTLLAKTDSQERDNALSAFYDKNRNDHLLVDKWLSLNAMRKDDKAIDHVRALLNHDAFSIKTPNKVRALIGMFAMGNAYTFNREDGEGYRLFTDVVLEADKINPQLAARLCGALRSWRTLETNRQALAKAQLERIKDTKPLSKDLYEIVTKTLDA
ncbi:MAG: aminopeptidase N, partial [Hyphomicrobiales bacterium]